MGWGGCFADGGKMIRFGILAGMSAAALAIGLCGSGLAQTGGPDTPESSQTEPSVKEEPPPGGCMPIGVTAAGDFVFPILCLGFIERHKAANQQPAAAEQPKPRPVEAEEAKRKPVEADEQRPASDAMTTGSMDDKSSAKKPDNVPPEVPKQAAAETAPSPKAEREDHHPHRRRVGPPGCTRFRSYDESSGTFRDYSGRRRACRS